MQDFELHHRNILKREFDRRKAKNKRYSLRAYAKFLAVDPAFLSKLLSGKVLLSLDTAAKMTKRLKLSDNEYRDFILSAIEEQKCHALFLIDPKLTPCDE